MRDLYADLGLTRYASSSDIEVALANRNDAIAERARFILLDRQRKLAYDKAYTAMLRVASARTALELSESVHWSQHEKADWSAKGDEAYPIRSKTEAMAKKTTKGYRALFFWIGVVLCAVLLRTCTSVFDNVNASDENRMQGNSAVASRDIARDSVIKPDPIQIPVIERLPSPRHNTMYVSRGRSKATIKVNTQKGVDYYLKLVDVESKKTVRSWFVQGGRISQIGVPAGTFYLIVNEGTSWCGAKLGFGPGTVLYRADDTFELEDTGNQRNGVEVTLYRVVGGNLSTTGISESEFQSYE